MRRLRRCVWAGLIIWCSACAERPDPETTEPSPVVIVDGPACDPPPAPPPIRVGELSGIVYHERVYGGAHENDVMPMVVSLHGMGDHPQALFHGFDLPLRVISPQAPIEYGDGYAWYVERSRGGNLGAFTRGVRTAARRLAEFLEDLAAARPTLGRPILTGMSQGGILTYAVWLHHREAISAAYPVAGWLPSTLWTWRRATGDHPPIVAMHGTDDEVVPLPPAKKLITHLERRGYPVLLLEFPGVAHETSLAMHEIRHLALQERVREMWYVAMQPSPHRIESVPEPDYIPRPVPMSTPELASMPVEP